MRDHPRARRLAHHHDAVGVTTERGRDLPHPGERGQQIAEPEVRRHTVGGEPAERAEAVVDADDDGRLLREPCAVVGGQRRAADSVAASGHPHDDGVAAVERRRPDLGGEAVFGLARRDHPGHEVEPADDLGRRRAGLGGVERLGPSHRLGRAEAAGAARTGRRRTGGCRARSGRRPGRRACRLAPRCQPACRMNTTYAITSGSAATSVRTTPFQYTGAARSTSDAFNCFWCVAAIGRGARSIARTSQCSMHVRSKSTAL